MIPLYLVLLLPLLPHTSGRQVRPIPGKDRFHTYEDVVKVVEEVTTAYPNLMRKEIIGKSVKNRDILCVKIGKDVGAGRPLLRPMVKLVANMHGNEVMGLEIMIVLMRLVLCTNNVARFDNFSKFHLLMYLAHPHDGYYPR